MVNNGTSLPARNRLPLPWLLTVYLFILLLYLSINKQSSNRQFYVAAFDPEKQQFTPTDLMPPSSSHNKICNSVDIRNSLEHFGQLKGCQVVEGFVQILLFDIVNETLLSNISFPELREITDYLLLYRVIGLRSIGQLFPNLSVIRGRELFNGYAFVVFEMSSLQEIGLYSLTDILRGQIRIDKNPSLCFINSIDWNLIAHEKGDHFIKSTKPENECPICPGDDVNSSDLNFHISSCPKAKHRGSNVPINRRLCWNRQHCQKVCPPNCSACNNRGECCDKKCLGGCSGEKLNVCDVCKEFSIEGGNHTRCVTECPKDKYEYMERRCINKQTCINLERPMELKEKIPFDYPFKIFKDKCIIKCPANYMDDYKNHECKLCEGRCKKICPASRIDSILAAQQLRGCTHINGSLEIQIRGGRNVVNALDENLNMIEEIDGYLKVVRSFPLVSFNFLRNLKAINGHTLDSDKYVFVVLDNQNLQDLWDWKNNRTLKIGRGKLFFHFNPKLCYYKIQELQQKTNLPELKELEVASNSNGDKIACNVTDLQVNVTTIDSQMVSLSWVPFKLYDQRKLLGYIVYSMEAPYKNVTLYDGRDACGEDGWRVDDVGTQDGNDGYIKHSLVGLKPFTQYAYYVKTYTIATEQTGAQSRIYYFKTLPDVPSPPHEIEVVSNKSDALYIKWSPPLDPNGNVTHYIIIGQRDNTTDDRVDRNYCEEPLIPPKPIIKVTPDSVKVKSNDTCSCDGDSKHKNKKIDRERDAQNQISFEDELQNTVYIKKDERNKGRKPRSVDILHSGLQLTNSSNNSKNAPNKQDPQDYFFFNVTGKTDIYITNVRHYANYYIFISACREKESEENYETYLLRNCSEDAIASARTEKKPGADNITNLRVTNNSLGMVSLTWDEPAYPNGVILTYIVEYKRVDNKNANPVSQCILRKEFKEKNNIHVLTQLSRGNYSVRVAAVSQARNGQYSDFIYFYVEEYTTTTRTKIFVLVFLSVLLILGLTGSAYFYWKRKYSASVKGMKLIASVNPEYISALYEPDEWEVPRKKIVLTEEIGQGSFGMVYKGIAKDIKGKSEIKCAVKTVNEHATNRERIEFLNEASVMKAFDTAHVVRLLGVVSQGQPTLVIMELMANGDLKSYLRSHRVDAENFTGKQPPTLKRILQMAIEIADGMAYLSAKKFVHRDLAARNCMVAEDLTVKIGDFGMTRDIYETDYYRKGTKGLLPVRWMAPESLKDGVFTSSSDVWSYGVVLWEMATLASQPYQGLSNDQVLRYVIDGGVMERPENCPDKLYTLMRFCWQHKQNMRPTFLELVSHLEDDAMPEFAQISFYHSSAGKEARNTNTNASLNQDDPSTPLHVARQLKDFSVESSEDDSEMEDLNADSSAHMNSPIKLPNDYSLQSNQQLQSSLKENLAINGFVNDRTTNGSANTQC
ncbi:insulin-like receptor [Agrilus planipennis]|uniref:Tyrosine-protein kinase receptor n=1 Tax=Agrilus planipennis TaxID=224129 RepID=A0A1W4XBR9_AGRPL|nr:insulin-like receptor [Agrilus planipennis]XP_018333469.1 insulin-like receptor [Agrilus planipennis]XP_025832339.1 insulin-like receptor [Agrilus planipennis]